MWIKKTINIYIVRADTYGTVEEKYKKLGVEIITFLTENAGASKKHIVEELGSENIIYIRNGFNDIQMFKKSKLSIAIMEDEGCSRKLLLESDIAVKSIINAFDLVINTNIMKTTFRN